MTPAEGIVVHPAHALAQVAVCAICPFPWQNLAGRAACDQGLHLCRKGKLLHEVTDAFARNKVKIFISSCVWNKRPKKSIFAALDDPLDAPIFGFPSKLSMILVLRTLGFNSSLSAGLSM